MGFSLYSKIVIDDIWLRLCAFFRGRVGIGLEIQDNWFGSEFEVEQQIGSRQSMEGVSSSQFRSPHGSKHQGIKKEF